MDNLNKIGVIGSGAMGNGIAHVAAQSGFKTSLIDIDDSQLNKALNAPHPTLVLGKDLPNLNLLKYKPLC